MYGEGQQTRSFCFVSDLVEGIFRLSQSETHDPVNIGNPSELTIREFAETIIRLTGTKSEIESRPLPEDDPKVRKPDISRARELLGWEPAVDLEKGLKQTIDYFSNRFDRNSDEEEVLIAGGNS